MRTNRKLFTVLGVLAIVLVVALATVACEDEDGTWTVGISQSFQHAALDSTAEGFIDAFEDAGYVDGENINLELQNAQGELANCTTIAKQFVDDNVDLIFTIATDSSEAAAEETEGTEIPVIFCAVTDPVAADLLVNIDEPEANITGVSDLLPVQSHLDLIMKVVPDAKTIGLLYNPGEVNSVVLVDREKVLAPAMGLAVVEATANGIPDVQAAAESLIGRVDAISVLTDNTVVSALDAVVQVCEENDIPLIAGDTASAEAGAVAAYGFEYYGLGYQAGQMALQVLQGTAIKDIPVQYATILQLAVNLSAAEAMGVTISDELLAEAVQTIE